MTCVAADGTSIGVPDADAAFALKADEKRTIIVPLGAVCTVIEVNPPADAQVSMSDSDGNGDGVVVADGVVSVAVTNTFPAAAVPAVTDPKPGVLSYTGVPADRMLGIGLVLLIAGAGLVLIGRRRRAAGE